MVEPAGDRFASYHKSCNVKLPSLANWRWGCVGNVLKALLKLEVPLRALWDEKAYKARVASVEMRGG